MTNEPNPTAETAAASDVEVASPSFAPLLPAAGHDAGALDLQSLLDIPVTVSVELGRVRELLDRVTRWAPGTVLDLKRSATEPVEVLVNGTPVARAEVVTVEDRYGIRIVELVSPEERLKRVVR